MSFCRICGTRPFSASLTEKLRNGIKLSECFRRNLSFQNNQLRDGILKSRSRRLMYLSTDVKVISSILGRNGFHREAAIARTLAEQIRCFSTSRPCRSSEEDKDSKKPNEEESKEFISLLTRFVLLSMFVFYLLVGLSGNSETMNTLSWKEFYYDYLMKGEVDRIEISSSGIVYVKLHDDNTRIFSRYLLNLPEGEYLKLEEKIRQAEKELGIAPENGLSIHYHRASKFQEAVFRLILVTMALLYLSRISKSMPQTKSMFDNLRRANFIRGDKSIAKDGKGIAFKDVAGLHEAKTEVMEFVDYLKHPAKYQELGAKVPRGALLLGPPGCGKTLLAKAVASEANVPFLAMAGSEFVEMLGGLGASRVRSLFKEARKSAPCIIYIDEIDAIGRQRGSDQFTSGETEQTLNQLLVEMDGMGTKEGVITLASTNRHDVLDKALLRPGRLDRHIYIGLPNLKEREELFNMYLKNIKMKESKGLASKLADLTPGMSGADIANICNEAALYAATNKKKIVEISDFDHAVERVLDGVKKKTSVLSPVEKKTIAYYVSGCTLVGWMLKHPSALLMASIIPKTDGKFGYTRTAPRDSKLISEEELFEDMCERLGGYVAESMTFNTTSTSSQSDLRKVTEKAYAMIRDYGMNKEIGPISFNWKDKNGLKPHSKKLEAIIDEEARTLVARAYKTAEKILKENSDKLNILVKHLLNKEVLKYEDVERLIGPPPHGAKKRVVLSEVPLVDATNKNSEERLNEAS